MPGMFEASGGFMAAVRSSKFGLMLVTMAAVLTWSSASRAYTPEQQQACSGDARRICGAYVPDVDRITVCMIQNKSQLSPGCRAHFRAPEPAAAPVAVGRPLAIKPVASKKPASAAAKKPAKPKKPAKQAA